MALKHKTAEMATINDTKKVLDSDSENEECIYMYNIDTPKGKQLLSQYVKQWVLKFRQYTPPPQKKKKKKIGLCIVFSSSWDGCNTRRNMKNKGYAKCWGQINCAIGDVQLAY